MKLKNYVAACFIILASGITTAQNNVCTAPENEIEDLNSIGKCAIENFKKSKEKEFVTISTRRRVVRKRNTPNILKLKKDLNAISKQKQALVAINKKAKVEETNVKEGALGETLLKNFVRFNQVTDQPVFITCSGDNSSNNDLCIKETISNNILENLIYPFDAASEGIEGRVWVRFIVDKEGYVKNITTSGPENGELLEKEAERLVTLLPKFMPGKQNNDYVNVEYFIPIDFELED